MPKTLDEAKKALLGLEGGNDFWEAISTWNLGSVKDEKDTGIRISKEYKGRLESVNKVLTDLGFNPSDIESFGKSLKDKLEKGKTATDNLSTSDERMQSMETKFSSLETKLTESEGKASKFENSLKHSTIKEALLKALSPSMYSADIHANNIISNGLAVLSDDNKTVMFKDGESTIDFEAGIQKYKDANKESIKDTQRGGSETSPSKGSTGENSISRAEYNKLTPEAQGVHMSKKDADVFD